MGSKIAPIGFFPSPSPVGAPGIYSKPAGDWIGNDELNTTADLLNGLISLPRFWQIL